MKKMFDKREASSFRVLPQFLWALTSFLEKDTSVISNGNAAMDRLLRLSW